MMGWHHDGLGWGGWLLMTVAMVAFWALVVLAFVTLFRSDSGSRAGSRTPEKILDERFARGEIDAEEYHQRYTALHHTSAHHNGNWT